MQALVAISIAQPEAACAQPHCSMPPPAIQSDRTTRKPFDDNRCDGSKYHLLVCSQLVARVNPNMHRLRSANVQEPAFDGSPRRENQDGESHRRHRYVRACLQPSMERLSRWHKSAGRSFNCSTDGITGTAGLYSSQCDAGAIGLLDLVLASQATSFVAVAVSLPWRSAFLEWIVQIRRLNHRESVLIQCD